METSEQKNSNFIVVSLKGRLDATNSAILEDKLHNYISQKEHNMILECSEMDYISSSGLRVLLSHLKKIRSVEGKLVLCNLTQNINEIFVISGFSSLFDIVSTLEEAKSKFV